MIIYNIYIYTVYRYTFYATNLRNVYVYYQAIKSVLINYLFLNRYAYDYF